MPGEVASCPVLVCKRSSIALLKGQEGKEDLNHKGHVAAVGHDEFTRIRDKRTREEMHLLLGFVCPLGLHPQLSAPQVRHICTNVSARALSFLVSTESTLPFPLLFLFHIGATVSGAAVGNAISTSCGDRRNVPILAATFGGSGCSVAID